MLWIYNSFAVSKFRLKDNRPDSLCRSLNSKIFGKGHEVLKCGRIHKGSRSYRWTGIIVENRGDSMALITECKCNDITNFTETLRSGCECDCMQLRWGVDSRGSLYV